MKKVDFKTALEGKVNKKLMAFICIVVVFQIALMIFFVFFFFASHGNEDATEAPSETVSSITDLAKSA